MNEQTIIRYMDLPEDLGRDWEWYPDLNLLVLRRGLDCEGRLQALDDMQSTWRRQHLRLVREGDSVTA